MCALLYYQLIIAVLFAKNNFIYTTTNHGRLNLNNLNSCKDIQWLNLPVIVPNVQVIQINEYICKKCDVNFCYELTNCTTFQAKKAEI